MLYVKDFTQMRDFYANVLQARPINTEWTDAWALFEVGGTGFALHAIPVKSCEEADPRSPVPSSEQSPVKLIFAVQDVLAERAPGGDGRYYPTATLAGTCGVMRLR
jgi:hypothetical protein